MEYARSLTLMVNLKKLDIRLGVVTFFILFLIISVVNPVFTNNIPFFNGIVNSLISPFKSQIYPASIPSDRILFGSYTGNDTLILFGDKILYPTAAVCSGSMHPSLGCNNILLMENLSETDEIYLGDIVSYNLDNGLGALHQVVEIKGDCHMMKGINNWAADPYCVDRKNMERRLVAVIYTRDPESFFSRSMVMEDQPQKA